jgi:hypothetical protein
MALYDPQMLAQQPIDANDTTYTFREPTPSTITCMAGADEMLRVGPEGFWVRGVKVPQDEHEAEVVYKAFKEFLTWSQLTRTY